MINDRDIVSHAYGGTGRGIRGWMAADCVLRNLQTTRIPGGRNATDRGAGW